jgi:hypothetical protein
MVELIVVDLICALLLEIERNGNCEKVHVSPRFQGLKLAFSLK